MRTEEDTDPFLQTTAMRGAGRKTAITWRAADKAASSTKLQICLEQNMKEMLRDMEKDTGNFILLKL